MDGTVPNARLYNGVEMPLIGLGTWQGALECDSNTVTVACKNAIDLGYRHFDTAELYSTETGLGEAIRLKIAEGKVEREDLFVTTKLWATSHRRGEVIPCLKRSLKTMGLEYVDMYLIHEPVAFQSSTDTLFPRDDNGELIFADEIDYTETWQGMEEALGSGLTRAIGISNFNQQQIERVLKMCKVKPMNHQIESSPYFNNSELIKFCKVNDITVTAYSPLAVPSQTFQSCQEIAGFGVVNKEGDPHVATDKVLLDIGSKYGKTAYQIALKFQVQRGVVVVPKSNTPSRMQENRDLFDFEMTEEEMEKIESLNRNFRVRRISMCRPSKEYPFKGE